MNISKSSTLASFALLSLLVIGTSIWGREFAKLQYSHIYILEWGLVSVAILAFFGLDASTYRSIKKVFSAGPFRMVLCFFLWGIIRLAFDLNTLLSAPSTVWVRAAQHSLIFVYPLLWVSMGIWAIKAAPSFFRGLVLLLVLISALPNFFGINIFNISIGPLLTCVSVCALYDVLQPKATQLGRKWLFAAIAIFFNFLPFWVMWTGKIQRTTLLLLALGITLSPWLLKKARDKVVLPIQITGILVSVLLAGIVVTSFIPRSGEERMSFFQSTFLAMQHGDDITDYSVPKRFEMPARFRKFCWKQAFADGLQNPLFGIGFLPEVPSMLPENRPNNAPVPLSGPHNSYLSVFARMGVIGIILLLCIYFQWLRKAWVPAETLSGNLISLVFFWVPIHGAIHAFLNIGLESPHNSMVMWLFVGAGFALQPGAKNVFSK